jgi:hypothetical protein
MYENVGIACIQDIKRIIPKVKCKCDKRSNKAEM